MTTGGLHLPADPKGPDHQVYLALLGLKDETLGWAKTLK